MNEGNQTTLTLVETAAKTAAEAALRSPESRSRRRRAMAISSLVSLAVMLSVALPAAYYLDRDRQWSALERARFNCDLQTRSADIQGEILEIGTDLRRENRAVSNDGRIKAALLKTFGPGLIEQLYAKQEANEARALRRWEANLSDLRELSRLDCREVLDESGVSAARP